MLERLPWILRGQFLGAAAFVALWAVFAKTVSTMPSIRRALILGLLVGIFKETLTLANFVFQPIPGNLAANWFFADLAQSALMGLVVCLIYRPAPAPVKKSSYYWLAIPVVPAVLLFGSPLYFRGTAQPKITVTATWMKGLDSHWTTQSPGKPYSVQSVSDIQKEGQDSLRFELRGGEQWVDEFRRASYRTEVDTKEYAPMRSVRWYACSLYLPADFPKEDNWLVLGQWHGCDKRHLGEVSRHPVLAFRYSSGRFYVTMWHSSERIILDDDAPAREDLFETNSFPLNQWNDFVVQAKWSYEDDGFINIWWNGKQVVQYRGPVGYNDNVGPYFKFGIYRGQSDKTYVAYYNRVRSGASPEDIGFRP